MLNQCHVYDLLLSHVLLIIYLIRWNTNNLRLVKHGVDILWVWHISVGDKFKNVQCHLEAFPWNFPPKFYLKQKFRNIWFKMERNSVVIHCLKCYGFVCLIDCSTSKFCHLVYSYTCYHLTSQVSKNIPTKRRKKKKPKVQALSWHLKTQPYNN